MGKSINRNFNNSITYSRRDFTVLNREFNKVVKELQKRDLNDIFNIKYKGHTFNCLPFLLNASGYYSLTFRNTMIDFIAKMNILTEPKSDLKLEHVDGLDIKLFNCLMPAMADLGMRLLCAFGYKYNQREVVRILYYSAIEVYENTIINNDMPYISYKYKSICNTQAFSYYCILIWLQSLSPMIKTYTMREFKRVKFFDILDSLIPEDSIHFKYITGEITSTELYNLYIGHNFSDGSSVVQREIMSNSSEGEYSGEDLNYRDLSLCNEIYDSYTLNEEYKMNMNLAYCLLYNGTYTKLNNSLHTKDLELQVAKENEEKADLKLKLVRDELNGLKITLQERDKVINTLQNEINSFTYDEKLREELEFCKNQINSLTEENSKLFDERIQQKRLISSQKKQLKQLSSSLIAAQDKDYEICDTFEEINEELNINDMVDKLKDLRIAYVGCDNNSIDNKLYELGFKHVTKITSSQRNLGKCDVLIIFTIRCHHAEVYKAEKMCKNKDVPKLYLSCINMEQLVTELYELMMG